MKFYIVDAFTETCFGGNPAGVVVLPEGDDFPSDEIMVKTAAELRYSETAFVKRLGTKEFQIRYFTPAAEVDLCGHATIGAFKALLYGGYIADNCRYMNHTLSGDIQILVRDGFILMDMAEPVKINEISDTLALHQLYTVMGLDYNQQKAAGLNLLPQIISTGLPDIIMPVATRRDLDNIAPDFDALTELSRSYSVVGVHAFALGSAACRVAGDNSLRDEAATCYTRNFAPLYDIDEEAATGTSSGALTYYGYLNGFVKDGDSCCFIQGEKMNRPSLIMTDFALDWAAGGCEEGSEPPCYIRVGGQGVILAEGEIHITEA